VSAGAACPEELEAMLEDACLLGDASLLANLFDVDAILLARGTSQVRGRPAIAKVIIDQLRDRGSYVGAPRLVMQSGQLALIISDAATSVARHSLDGWRYVISRLDLSSPASIRPDRLAPPKSKSRSPAEPASSEPASAERHRLTGQL
jgi:hypothetical protein